MNEALKYHQQRTRIGNALKELRLERRYPQEAIANLLQTSQRRISEIERGIRSLTAEEFLDLLSFFNVTIATFGFASQNPIDTRQNTLVRFGAVHLIEADQAMPDETLDNPTSLILDILQEKNPPARQVAALAPVLVRNIDKIHLPKLWTYFDGQSTYPRLIWFFESVLKALESIDLARLSRGKANQIRKTKTQLEVFLNPLRKRPAPSFEDLFCLPNASKKTCQQVREESSAIARRWRILTPIQVDDLFMALRDANVAP